MLHVVEGDALSKDPVSPALIDENHRDEAGGGDGHDGQGWTYWVFRKRVTLHDMEP